MSGVTADSRDASEAPDPVVSEAVDAFYAVFRRMNGYFGETAAGLDLTYQQAHLLRSLTRPTPMRGLARRLHLDASNLTGLVDRLEERGLVERRADLADRRVRQLALTREGERLRDELEGRLMARAPLVEGLGAADRERLRDLLRRVANEGPPAVESL